MPKNRDFKKPKKIQVAEPVQTGRIERQESTEHLPPLFSLQHLQSSYGIDACEKNDQAAFAERICKLGQLSWQTIHQAHKHSVGCETIKPNSIKPPKPDCIGDRAILALRYSGNKPMVGFKDGRVLNILWIERQFGDVYDHG
jgi:hypothetical protein